MGRYDGIIHRLTEWGKQEDRLRAALIIGSQAREDYPADEYSDLDIVMAVDDTDYFLCSDQWLEQIGNFHISFVEATVDGGKERRVLFDGALDADFVILPRENLDNPDFVRQGGGLLNRGYCVLIDKIGLTAILSGLPSQTPPYTPLSEQEFINLVSDFWYHSVWTAKKIRRGELWTAISCADSYMKGRLLRIMECHAHVENGLEYDTWHNGRFLEKWAADWIVKKLAGCFAQYEELDIKRALLNTMDLFRRVAVETADRLFYTYPKEADEYASVWVNQALWK